VTGVEGSFAVCDVTPEKSYVLQQHIKLVLVFVRRCTLTFSGVTQVTVSRTREKLEKLFIVMF